MTLKNKRLLSIACLLLIVFIGVMYFLQDNNAPTFTLTPETELVSLNLPLTLHAEDVKPGIKSITVAIRIGERVIPVIDKTFTEPVIKEELVFDLKSTALRDGPVELEVTVTDASMQNFTKGNSNTKIIPITIDSIPPNISVKTTPPNIRRGGTGCILYSVSKEVSQTGVKVGDLFFPGFRQANGDYLCFFAFPYYMLGNTYIPQVVAMDKAGNMRTEAVNLNRIHIEFKKDSINIGQSFLDKKNVEFTAIYPGEMSDLERFLKVNGPVRKANADTLLGIGKDTSADILWNGTFLRLPRSAPRAGFADHRTYYSQEKQIDEQIHLGFDLASVVQAPIPASNTGRVVFAGYLGIYGNLVIIDHGLGLQSLYSHMTDIKVQKDQRVEKGEIIGTTGNTGMAGGDHLHFGMLVSGLEVTPQEWLDAHWIKDNISTRILAAGGFFPDIQPELEAKPAPTKAPAKVPAKTPAKKSGTSRRR